MAPEGWRVPSHVDIENLFKIEFPNYYSDWKVINDKEAQGLNTRVDRDKLAIKYKINPVTLVSVKTFSNQHKSCFYREEYGDFKDNIWDGPVFWTAIDAWYTTNDGYGVSIRVVKRAGKSAQVPLQVSETDPPVGISNFVNGGIGYPVRLIKTN